MRILWQWGWHLTMLHFLHRPLVVVVAAEVVVVFAVVVVVLKQLVKEGCLQGPKLPQLLELGRQQQLEQQKMLVFLASLL
jgi:hypothetical protein